MTQPVARHRPKMYPPPEFPPRQPKLFARTPPVVFPALLGLLGLVLAVRAGLGTLGWPRDVADLAAGVAVPLWVFAAMAYGVKLIRRPSALMDDLRVLPGRGGVASATMGGMAVAAVIAPFAPGVAMGTLIVALVAHVVQALLMIAFLVRMPREARGVNPTFHLTFVGLVVGGIAAALLGAGMLATVLFWISLPVAVIIWAVSARNLASDGPPAPLRPLLAIHVSPASILSIVAGLIGQAALAQGLLILAVVLAGALVVRLRWLLAAGPTPLWGSFTFPLAALTGAMLAVGGMWEIPGLILLAFSLGAIPWLAWHVLKQWPGGKLAARTNASEA